ncbi:DUF4132 domain-containing protein [Actinosynnema pretiosum subsp. pretiosum]|uniref:DUF4132 domain-containing protein n=1 Tax=Actinosynnema pretiosum subsp. pretiosum TaxID=103721 RepID=A0AA45L7M0_9PSEU|nr:DUF4132 domain-containing protein [Actinosynnema pretiosum subsp. pretiosum]
MGGRVSSEDAYVMGGAQARQVLPRRGDGREGRALTPDAAERVRGLIAAARESLAEDGRGGALANALEEHLAAPGPVSAGIAHRIVEHASGTWQVEETACFVDAWVAEHGVVFAAEAALCSALHRIDRDGALTGRFDTEAVEWSWAGHRPLARVRHALAAASDAEHAAAVERVAAHRGTLRGRTLAAFLLPTETGWVGPLFEELAGLRSAFITPWLFLGSVGDREWLEALVDRCPVEGVTAPSWVLPTLVDAVGPEGVLPTLVRWLPRLPAAARKRVLGLVAEFPLDEAFAVLAGQGPPGVKPLRDAVKRFPERAARLAPAELLPAPADPLPEARADEPVRLPRPLVDPPWEVAPVVERVVVPGLTPIDRPGVVWRPGEREEWLERELFSLPTNPPAPADWSRALDEVARANDGQAGHPVLLLAPEEPARRVVVAWRPENAGGFWAWGPRLVARFGVDAAGVVAHVGATRRDRAVEVAAPLVSAAIATLFAEWGDRLKSMRGPAAAYFARHGVEAARPLVPAALGTREGPRRAAERALRLVADDLGEDAVLAVAAEYGPGAEAGVRALFDRDPLALLPRTRPSTPEWANPLTLPPVLLRDGGPALPAPAVANLLAVLAVPDERARRAGLVPVREVCDPASLAAFGRALLRAWLAEGALPAGGWALTAQGVIGDDETARELAGLIDRWPGEGAFQRAVTGLGALGSIGTDTALRAVDLLARKGSTKGLRERAAEAIALAAAGAGLDPEQLADRLVPDCGIGAGVVLDYGPRSFPVEFDRSLTPLVVLPDGRRRKSAPTPAATDDPELAAAARARFSLLRKEITKVAAEQAERLERAMVVGRRWRGDEFRALFTTHPLLSHLALRLVWAVFGEDGPRPFRLAEDRTAADVADALVELADDAVIGLAHPLHLAGAIPVWSELFADYEVVQPFPQLGRPWAALTEAERAGSSLSRFAGEKAAPGRLLGLIGKGWSRDASAAPSAPPWLRRRLDEGRWALLDLDRGLPFSSFEHLPHLLLGELRLSATGGPGRDPGDPPFSGLDPVLVSELLADVGGTLAR